MNFKDMLSNDAQIFTNDEEMGVMALYKGVNIDVLYDELDDSDLDSGLFRISAAQSLVLSIAKDDIFTIEGVDYKVLDFQPLDGMMDIVLNKKAAYGV